MAPAGDEARPETDGPKSEYLQLLRALADPARLKLMKMLSYQRNISPAEFAKAQSEPMADVLSHFQTLESLHCIELAETRQLNGSPEHFYRRGQKVVFDDGHWVLMPEEEREVITNSTVDNLVDEMYRALRAGTFTAREDAHISWQANRLDEAGWKATVSILEGTLKALAEVQEEAEHRLAETGAEGMLATVALAGFESPRGGPDQPEETGGVPSHPH